MARQYSHRRGQSGSTRPNVDTAPTWSEQDKKRIEELILELADEGHSAAMIGTLLRDQHAVPDVRLVLGERISAVLARNERQGRFPEDMMNLMRRAVGLLEHLEGNHKDLHNARALRLTESKIRRLTRYHQNRGRVATDWKYSRAQLRLIVE